MLIPKLSRLTRPVPLLVILLLLLHSCIKDNFEFDRISGKISYRPSFLIPVAFGTLTLGNLLEADDSLIFFDQDNSIRVTIREDSIFSFSSGDFLEIPVPAPVFQQFTMEAVEIEDFTSSATITLGDLTSPGRLNDPEATEIRMAAGNSIPFPLLPAQNPGKFSAGEPDNIDWADLTGGSMEMEVTNNLPVEVSMDILVVNDDVPGEEVALFTFENLAPGATGSGTALISGETVRSRMSLDILNFRSPGSGSEEVFVNLDDALEISISAEDLLAWRGRAMVPVTVLDSDSDMLDMPFGEGVDLDVLNLEQGYLNYSLPNNLPGMKLNVDLLNVSTGGVMMSLGVVADGGGEMMDGSESLADADFDLSGAGNSIAVEYTLVIGSEEEMTAFDLGTGEFGFNLSFSDFFLGYASGFFGTEEAELEEEVIDLDFDLFDKITGDIRLTNPSVRIFYENSTGVPVHLSFNLTGEDAAGNREVSLFGENHEGFSLEYPAEPFSTVSGEIVIDRESSNIVDLIALPPSKLSFGGKSLINPGGRTETPNFITTGSSLRMGMEFDLPLELMLANVILTDTLEMDLDPGDLDIIERMVMTLGVTNGFPLGVAFDLSLYDSTDNTVLHSFENIVLMEAAPVDANGRSIPGEYSESEARVEVDAAVTDHFKRAGHVIVSVRFNTGRHNNQQVPVSLLTTDKLDFRIRLSAGLNINN